MARNSLLEEKIHGHDLKLEIVWKGLVIIVKLKLGLGVWRLKRRRSRPVFSKECEIFST